MAFSFVNSSSITGNSVTTLSLPVPTGVLAGDILLFASTTFSATTTWPSGVTALASGNGQSASHNWSVAYKIATGSESAYTVTYSATTWPEAMCYAIRGGSGVAPTAYSTVNASATYPTTLPAASGALGSASDATVYCWTGINSGATGTETLTFPGTLTDGAQVTNTACGSVIGFAWGTDVTAPGSATSSTAIDYADFLFDVQTSSVDYTANPADGSGLSDALPVAPPDGLAAAVISSTEIDLSWYRLAGAQSYDLERNGVVIATGLTGLTYADTGLTASTTYTYNIRSLVAASGTGQ